MAKIDIKNLSKTYDVRKLNPQDTEMIIAFCKDNPQYYEHSGKKLSAELIESDMRITPPGIPPEQKYYIGFFNEGALVAIVDLIDGYPNGSSAFIGFFMMNKELQGTGTGSRIISEVLSCLKNQGYKSCRLGIDKGNPQSGHFWAKNGFEVIREVAQETGSILVAEKNLEFVELP